jgi:hypothetical protein
MGHQIMLRQNVRVGGRVSQMRRFEKCPKKKKRRKMVKKVGNKDSKKVGNNSPHFSYTEE